MNARFCQVFGAFGILRRRAVEERCPELSVWVGVGERAAGAVRDQVRDDAHKVEVGALSLEAELREMLADGVIDDGELRRLQRAPDRLHAVSERARILGEVVS